MEQRRFLFLLLPALTIHDSSFPQLDMEKARLCPYPWPEDISPCACWENEKFQVFVTCNMDRNISEEDDEDHNVIMLLKRAFRCNEEIFSLDINLNGYIWDHNITSENIGRFKMSYFSISNFSSIDGFVKPGAFSLSQETLLRLRIQKKEDNPSYYSYMEHKSGVETGAFSDLRSLTSITIDGLEKIYPDAFSNLPNLRELTLSRHGMETLLDVTSVNLPSLALLNLRNNKKMKHIGNLLSNLQNPDLVIDLRGNMIEELREEEFKPFLDNVFKGKGKGYIDLLDNPLQCGCDTQWFVASRQKYQDMLRNAQCIGPQDQKYQENSTVVCFSLLSIF